MKFLNNASKSNFSTSGEEFYDYAKALAILNENLSARSLPYRASVVGGEKDVRYEKKVREVSMKVVDAIEELVDNYFGKMEVIPKKMEEK